MLGVVGATVSMNYASSGREKVLDQLRSMGTNVLLVSAAQSRQVGGRARTGSIVTTLKEGDFESIRTGIPLLSGASRLTFGTFLVKAGDLAKNNTTVLGCDPDYAPIKNWAVASGTFFTAFDEKRSARVAVLGAGIAAELFPDGSPLGVAVQIDRVPFVVVGVMAERGQGLDTANEDEQVLVPLTTATRRLTRLDFYAGFILRVERYQEMDEAARLVRQTLESRHHVPAPLPPDFSVLSQRTLLETEQASAARLRSLVLLVGASALLVSGIGILGVLWMSMRDRTREIGTCRAVGATASDIFLQLLFEGLLLSLLGSVLGVMAAWGATVWVDSRTLLPFVFDKGAARATLVFSVVVNLLFTLIPSRRAARATPVAALRFE